MVAAGTNPGAVVKQLRALMETSTAPRDDRWKARFDEIPRLVDSARAKIEQKRHPPSAVEPTPHPTITLSVGETERRSTNWNACSLPLSAASISVAG